MPHKLFRHFGRYLFLLLLFLVPFLRNALAPDMIGNSAYAYLILDFGGVYSTKSVDFMTLILSVVPNLLLIYAFSDVMREDCMTSYVYVFTRMAKKQKWLLRKAEQLFVNVLTVYLLLYALAFAIAWTVKLTFSGFSVSVFLMLATMLLLNVLSLFFMVYLQNFLSLHYGGTQAFLITMLLYLIPLAVGLVFYNSSIVGNLILGLFIPTNQMYLWHADCLSVPGAEMLLDNPLHGFKCTFSLVILCAYILLEYCISRHIFLTRDTVELMKEE